MATFNAHSTNTAAELLGSSVAVAAATEHFERSTAAATTTFLVPSTATANGTPLHLEPFSLAGGPHFVTTTTSPLGGATSAHHHPHTHQQQQHHHHQQTNSTSTSYTFVQIKREPCQVSEVTSANCHQTQQQQHQHHQQHHVTTSSTTSGGGIGVGVGVGMGVGVASSTSSCSASISAASKTMSSSSTLTTLVKIEASSPKVNEMDKTATTLNTLTAAPAMANTNNTVPIGIAVARKRPQETAGTLSNSTAIPMQQTLNKDLNCFGIRVADLGGVSTGCSNIYFTGNGDLVAGSATAEELALSAAGVQSVNRAPSTFWQYQNALPIESVISMSPATVGLQYSRDASRGQVVLLPATPAALGISNFPIYTPTDPFQQAAAFVWPSYLPQGTTPAAAAAAATLQPPPNFIFPSMSPHSTLQPQSYATSLQLFGSNYLTAAAAAAAAAAATSTLCQHNQQQTSTQQTTSSINLSLAGAGPMPPGSGGGGVGGVGMGSIGGNSGMHNMSNNLHNSNGSGGRFLSLATTGPPVASMLDAPKPQKTLQPTLTLQQPVPPPPPPPSLLLPPNAMKIEEWNAADFMAAAAAAAAKTSAHPTAQPNALHYNSREKMSTTSSSTTTNHLLDLQNAAAAANAQALNLMRLPTPPTSATMETAAAAAGGQQLQPQLLFHTTSTPSPALLNLSASLPRGTVGSVGGAGTTTVTPTGIFINGGGNATPSAALSTTIGPPTPLCDEPTAINFKISPVEAPSQPPLGGFVVGVPRVNNNNNGQSLQSGPPPQMQDVNIQTDTPVCSDDENSTCPLAIQHHQQQQQHQQQLQQQQLQQQLHPTQSNAAEPPSYMNESDVQQPLELTKQNYHSGCSRNSVEVAGQSYAATKTTTETNQYECHNESDATTSKEAEYEAAMSQQQQHTSRPSTVASIGEAVLMHPVHPVHDALQHCDQQQSGAEDLTGLELLSNISASTLASKGIGVGVGMAMVRVKQEPLDHMDVPVATMGDALPPPAMSQSIMAQPATNNCDACIPREAEMQRPPTPLPLLPTAVPPLPPVPPAIATTTVVEPLGGLKLLCALAEQRIQEEVQSSRGNLFDDSETAPPPQGTTASFDFQMPQPQSQSQLPQQQQESPYRLEQSSFPSMEGIELPSTSGLGLGIGSGGDQPVKRKKHKHSKSSKSSSSSALGGGSGKKSQRCSKKSKKKYAKEKRKHKQQQQQLLASAAAAASASASDDVDFEDEQLQQELKSAFNRVDPNFQLRFGQWANAQEIFELMESDMRMRLADITRQYRKKKRKLDEISKNKKKKKCAKMLAAQQQQQQQQPTLSLASLSAAGSGGSLNCGTTTGTSLPLCDYKFPKFSTNSGVGATSTPYLNRSSFLRFGEKAPSATPAPPHAQFPPAECDNSEDNNALSTASSSTGPSMAIYKPVRLGPSALAGAVAAASVGADMRNGGTPLRHAQKHTSSDKSANTAIICKEPKLMAVAATSSSSLQSSNRRSNEALSSSTDEQRPPSASLPLEHKLAASVQQISKHTPLQRQEQLSSTAATQSQQQQQQQQPQQQQNRTPTDAHDFQLMLTNEHLYRKETRVLTDMGGLFYAGVMKPLQPPDVYAITLDGERGNKSHIMSREEIFKDTILEVAPKSVDSIPVGTRLCAYWSQQYRCLYPGRAIESESSDDGETPNDSVSVEFDDGDSGRIRLQNIRFLLSDYPIVVSLKKGSEILGQSLLDDEEISSLPQKYNDNPLYSLGKHKKSGTAARNTNGFGNSHNSNDAHEHTSIFALTDAPTAAPSTCDIEPPTQSAKDISAQRKEKKRIKNLKKKTQAAAALAASASVNGNASTATTNGGGLSTVAVVNGTSCAVDDVAAIAENNRKHHKHKKRKKHKKHHHRKANGECEAINGVNNTFVIKNAGVAPSAGFLTSTPTSSYKGNKRCEFSAALVDNHSNGARMLGDEAVASLEQHVLEEVVQTPAGAFQAVAGHNKSQAQSATSCMSAAATAATIKMEAAAAAAAAAAVNAKVKTEHLDLEEESTSNMMSELSDENKCDDDEVEHNNSKGSKIAAFLPERQLWGWQGKAYRKAGVKGRARKQFYKTIKRGKETITVGDCAVFLSTGRPDRPYIGRIESMWETTSSNKVVRVRWFYHPEETTGCPNLKYPGALFESPHEDENDVQTISHRCEVLPFERYFAKFGTDSKQYQSIYDNNDTYYLAGYYNPRIQVLNLQDEIPTLKAEQQQQQQQQQAQQLEKQQQPQLNGQSIDNENACVE